MNRRCNLMCVITVVFLVSGLAHAADRQPNFVVIFADDLGYGDIGAYRALYQGGDDKPPAYRHTPTLDQLATQGVRFTRAYASGWCAPSRQVLLSGRWVNRTDAYNYPWIGNQLRREGYVTGMVGKSHGVRPTKKTFGDVDPKTAEFDDGLWFNGGAREFFLKPGETFPGRKCLQPFEFKAAGGEHLTDVFTDHAVDFIERNSEKPFMLYLPYTAPHEPLQGKPEDLKKLFPDVFSGMSDAAIRETWKQRDNKQLRACHYAAVVYGMDQGIGRIMQTLRDEGLAENTWVIFTSDNGAQHGSNYPLSGRKWDGLEGGYRVPFIVWSADLLGSNRSGTIYDGLVSIADIAPTLLGLGARTDQDFPTDGVNLIPYLMGEKPPLTGRTYFCGNACRKGQMTGYAEFWDQQQAEAHEGRLMQTVLIKDDQKILCWNPQGTDVLGAVHTQLPDVVGQPNPVELLREATPQAGVLPETRAGKSMFDELFRLIGSNQRGLQPDWSGAPKRESNQYSWWVHGIKIADAPEINYLDPHPFGTATQWARDSDNVAIGEWWNAPENEEAEEQAMRAWFTSRPRDKTLAFAIYTHDDGVLKLTAQCFPLLEDEPKQVTLEIKRGDQWVMLQKQPVLYPGWSAHFRVENWDHHLQVPYRVRLGELSTFEGVIRRDPAAKDTIVVASMSCNSPKDRARFERTELVQNLIKHDPDLLFFAGDQNYTHDEATFGWLQFGVQFAELLKDRPTICIPDDHDVGHANLWGEAGGVSKGTGGAADGGYMYPASFVNMVERMMTWNLPDPFDSTPVQQGIGVYYTELTLGGISFAILEDRKFKTGPLGEIPPMGPRPDHINDPSYDRKEVDKPGLKLLGDRQLEFLNHWVQDWTGAEVKVALSQTAFCGAVHLHGNQQNRLLADLDCNGWPQTGRNKALEAIRRARAFHLCGDQHLAVVVKHGIDQHRDGPYAFTSPALVNTIYGRWWSPANKQPGGGEKITSPLPWVGDYEDGLGNKITMFAYANPEPKTHDELTSEPTRENRGDGYALVRIHKPTGDVTFECWPRFADLSQGDAAQFKGWPVRINLRDNDRRQSVGFLNEVRLPVKDAVVALINDETGELVYCYRVKGHAFRAPVYSAAKHTLKAGKDRPEQVLLSGERAQ
jgi:arylsulfatase A-like enzyme